MNRLEFLSLLIPSVGSFVLVILAWMNSSQRMNRLEQVVDSLSRDLREFYRTLANWKVEWMRSHIDKRISG